MFELFSFQTFYSAHLLMKVPYNCYTFYAQLFAPYLYIDRLRNENSTSLFIHKLNLFVFKCIEIDVVVVNQRHTNS